MTKLERLRLRYIQDPVPVRLGGLAANLARIASFSKNQGHRKVVSTILHESKWFVEWTAAQLEIQRTADLVELQMELVVWELQAHDRWEDETWRLTLAAKAERWSQRILDMSGLLG